MGIQEDLNSFINKHRVEKGKPFTHTSLGNPKASFFIGDEDYDAFMNLYSLAFQRKIWLG